MHGEASLVTRFNIPRQRDQRVLDVTSVVQGLKARARQYIGNPSSSLLRATAKA